MFKLASILTAGSLVALMASTNLQPHGQTTEPASAQGAKAEQIDKPAPDESKASDQAPSLSEALSSLLPSSGATGQLLRDADLGRAALHDPLGRRHRTTMSRLTPELIEQCLEVAHDVKPQLASRLERLKRESSEANFEQAMRRNARHLVGLVRLRERNPGLYDLKMRELQTGEQIQQVTAQLREALATGSIGQTELLETELHGLVQLQASQAFEARGRYLLRIKEHMDALAQQIDEEGANFPQTVERRFQEILDEIKSSSPTSDDPTSG